MIAVLCHVLLPPLPPPLALTSISTSSSSPSGEKQHRAGSQNDLQPATPALSINAAVLHFCCVWVETASGWELALILDVTVPAASPSSITAQGSYWLHIFGFVTLQTSMGWEQHLASSQPSLHLSYPSAVAKLAGPHISSKLAGGAGTSTDMALPPPPFELSYPSNTMQSASYEAHWAPNSDVLQLNQCPSGKKQHSASTQAASHF
mmetsp:Transcript_11201/g.26337  ORF Transcript_11201/g.26337 Transcript_11201/m.26337 type:complete len:206 (-) Transcript_11201:669-1286(-)